MSEAAPIPMLIWCPACVARHIDEGEFATRSHRDHACQNCGLVFRPALVPTVGVKFLPGYKNDAHDPIKIEAPVTAPAAPAVECLCNEMPEHVIVQCHRYVCTGDSDYIGHDNSPEHLRAWFDKHRECYRALR